MTQLINVTNPYSALTKYSVVYVEDGTLNLLTLDSNANGPKSIIMQDYDVSGTTIQLAITGEIPYDTREYPVGTILYCSSASTITSAMTIDSLYNYQIGIVTKSNIIGRILLNNNLLPFTPIRTGNLYMNDNTSATTISNTSSYFKAVGVTTGNTLNQNFTHSNNRLTYNCEITHIFNVSSTCSLASGNNQSIRTIFYKNGSPINDSMVKVTTSGSGAVENLKNQAIIELSENDYIEFYVRNATATNNITVQDLNLIIKQ